MKREEKNQISRQRILESAAKEFAEKGYGLSSINVICAEGDISKGILYHYFKDKDELYLTCVQACFDGLTAARKPLCRTAWAIFRPEWISISQSAGLILINIPIS